MEKVREVFKEIFFGGSRLKRFVNILIVILLVIGLVVLINIVSQRQKFRAKADVNFSENFTITETTPSQDRVVCDGSNCTSNTRRVHIKFNPEDAQELLQGLP